MMESFAIQVRDELAAEPPPPRDIVAGALKAGRTTRRARLAGAIVGAVTAVVLVVAAVPTALTWFKGPPRVAIVAVPANGPDVPATPAAALEVLRVLMPGASFGEYDAFVFSSDQFSVYVEATTARGKGSLRLNITYWPGRYAARCPDLGTGITCRQWELSDRTRMEIFQDPANCVNALMVSARRPDDTEVTLWVPTCLDSMAPAPQLLTVDEALSIVANPALKTRMASSLVTAGAEHFPNLPGSP
jgi:hypothetical protein